MPVRPELSLRRARSLRDRHGERLLFRRVQATGDRRARELLVERYMGLAKSAAARYSSSVVPQDDLVQVASLGLLKAIDRFDPDRGVAFSSFAVPTMVGELRRYFRDSTWMVRPPRDLQERVLRLEQTTEALSGRLGRLPTVAELTHATGLSAEEILESSEARHARGGVSLEQPVGEEDHVLGAMLGREDPELGRVEYAVVEEDLLAELTPRERAILRLRFHEDLTQREIADLLGCSQMHVSRLLRAALDQLSASAASEREELLAAV